MLNLREAFDYLGIDDSDDDMIMNNIRRQIEVADPVVRKKLPDEKFQEVVPWQINVSPFS